MKHVRRSVHISNRAGCIRHTVGSFKVKRARVAGLQSSRSKGTMATLSVFPGETEMAAGLPAGLLAPMAVILDKDSRDEGQEIVYLYPPDLDKKTKAFPELRRLLLLFLGLHDVLRQIALQRATSTIFETEDKTTQLVVGYTERPGSVVAVAVPHGGFSLTAGRSMLIECIVEECARAIEFRYGKLDTLIRPQLHADVYTPLSSIKSGLNELFRWGIDETRGVGHSEVYHNVFSEGTPMLQIPLDIRSRISELVTAELDFVPRGGVASQIAEDPNICFVVGSCLFYRNAMVYSHLPAEVTRNITTLLRARRILPRNRESAPMALATEVFCKSELQQFSPHILTVLSQDVVILCILLQPIVPRHTVHRLLERIGPAKPASGELGETWESLLFIEAGRRAMRTLLTSESYSLLEYVFDKKEPSAVPFSGQLVHCVHFDRATGIILAPLHNSTLSSAFLEWFHTICVILRRRLLMRHRLDMERIAFPESETVLTGDISRRAHRDSKTPHEFREHPELAAGIPHTAELCVKVRIPEEVVQTSGSSLWRGSIGRKRSQVEIQQVEFVWIIARVYDYGMQRSLDSPTWKEVYLCCRDTGAAPPEIDEWARGVVFAELP